MFDFQNKLVYNHNSHRVATTNELVFIPDKTYDTNMLQPPAFVINWNIQQNALIKDRYFVGSINYPGKVRNVPTSAQWQ